MFTVKLLIIVLLSVNLATAKVFSRCDLAKTLVKNYKFLKKDIANWVCLIESESGRNTAAKSPTNSNGSRDYGLFQINSLYWCSGGKGSHYNECHVSCKNLTDSDISDDVKCAQLIYSRQGFKAWYGWQHRCQNHKVSSYISGCKI
ncbi:hypothetical protein CHUAL_012473 [Chamberlinius hualienensis]